MTVVEQHKDSLTKLCRTFQVEKMYLFGSALNSKFNEQSDLDFLVKFKPIELSEYFDNYIGFKENLESLFKRKVDLLEEQTVKNPILINSINNSKKIVYG
ncbi:nucleotidyltransferase family protein [Pedobacter arcticus]|uniref:nucleotidyltransferase family protein n=1 Tax=Pedobacter arcticus TaxID=752140 RepID=UPI00030CFE23|nr:nucleotidyltransferase domain-containing protein [Pedobacter arcticus]